MTRNSLALLTAIAALSGCIHTAPSTDTDASNSPRMQRMTMKPIIFTIDTATRTIVSIEQK